MTHHELSLGFQQILLCQKLSSNNIFVKQKEQRCEEHNQQGTDTWRDGILGGTDEPKVVIRTKSYTKIGRLVYAQILIEILATIGLLIGIVLVLVKISMTNGTSDTTLDGEGVGLTVGVQDAVNTANLG